MPVRLRERIRWLFGTYVFIDLPPLPVEEVVIADSFKGRGFVSQINRTERLLLTDSRILKLKRWIPIWFQAGQTEVLLSDVIDIQGLAPSRHAGPTVAVLLRSGTVWKLKPREPHVWVGGRAEESISAAKKAPMAQRIYRPVRHLGLRTTVMEVAFVAGFVAAAAHSLASPASSLPFFEWSALVLTRAPLKALIWQEFGGASPGPGWE